MYKQRIVEVLTEMEGLLIRFTRIKKEGVQRVLVGLDDSNEEHQKALFEFLMDFRTTEYAELHRIFRLPLDAGMTDMGGYVLWQRYFDNGKTNLVEMQLFRTQEKVCREKWATCPKLRIINHGKEKGSNENPDQQNPQGISAEPQGSRAASTGH
jgi:hypothetical protein